MPETLGARLRRQREDQNIALATIAEQTKIKASLLEGLERDDVSRWPSGIFRRAYIRAYAHAIGLDPDEILREFALVHPDPEEKESLEAISAAVNGPLSTGGPPTRFRYMVDTAVASLSRLGRSAAAAAVAAKDRSTSPVVSQPQPAIEDDPPLESSLLDSNLAEEVDAAVSGDDLPRAVSASAPPEQEQVQEGEREREQEPEQERNPGPVQPVQRRLDVGSFLEVAAEQPEPPMPGLPVDSQSPDARPIEQQVSAIVLETGPESSANEPRPDESPTFEVDLRAFAALCTRLGRVEHADELQAIFQELAGLLSATGVIVWMWNEEAGELRPSLVHGYSARVVAQLPGVAQDADNVTAAAFRSNEPCAIAGTEFVNGALAVPLLTMDGCAGVLALELGRGLEATGSVRATATIFAALLAQLVGDAALGGFRHRGALAVPQVGAARRVLRVNARGDHARTPVRSSTGSPSRANAADRRRTAYSEKR